MPFFTIWKDRNSFTCQSGFGWYVLCSLISAVMFLVDCFAFLVCSFSLWKAWLNKTGQLTGSGLPLIQMPKWNSDKPMWNWVYLGLPVNLVSLDIVDWINWDLFSILTIHYFPLTKVRVLWEQDHPGLAGICRFGLILLMSGKEPGLYCKISFGLAHHLNSFSSLSR